MNEKKEISQRTSIIASYSISNLAFEIYFFIAGTYFFYFWEVEVGLAIWLVSIGFMIYAIYNAINDPVVGIILDKPMRFWKKWGKRFPYMVIFSIPWILSIALIFSPPDVDSTANALLLFGWLVLTLCLCDTFFSIVATGQKALLPDKFRSLKERRKISSFLMLFGLIGTVIAALIPPMFIVYGQKSSFAFMSWILVIILLILFVLYIPGIREDKWMRQAYIEGTEEKGLNKLGFIETAKKVFKQRNFVVLMIVYLVSDIASVCLMASLNYVVVYVLREEADEFMLIMLIYIIGSIASIPIWFKLSQKMNNNKKLFIIACIVNVIFLVPIGFITDLNIFLIMAIFLGIGMTGFKIALIPLFADTLDEALVFNKRHIEASYSGFLVFILRFSLFAQALIFGIVHTITGFNPSPNAPQTPLAIFGIQLHFALIPAILFVIGILIFWKSYALTPEKTAELKEKIKELNL